MKSVTAFFLAFLFSGIPVFASEILTPPTPEIECIVLTKTLQKISGTVPLSATTQSEVVLLQKFLSAQGYFHSAPTGTFGKVTEAAVKAYQKKEGIQMTGAVGPKTRESIAKKNCGSKVSDIKNEVLSTSSISLISTSSKNDNQIAKFTWNFHGKKYEMTVPISDTLYAAYKDSPKVYSYKGKLPANWMEEYDTAFLLVKPDDYTFDTVTNALLSLARKDGMTADETANFALSFVQGIPYDFSKDLKKDKTQYPYETLFTKKGVCADKTFLAYHILKRLGYGVAILQYLEVNHQAVGIQCPNDLSMNGSGYCFGETTNYLPIGVVPNSFGANGISGGLNKTSSNFEKLLDGAQLGKEDILVKITGKSYGGMPDLKNQIKRLTVLSKEMTDTKDFIASSTINLDAKKNELVNSRAKVETAVKDKNYALYTVALTEYNSYLAAYQVDYKIYQDMVALYNKDVKEYNAAILIFDQDK